MLDQLSTRVAELIQSGSTVLVHCNSGKGRTGLFGGAVLDKLQNIHNGTEIIKLIRTDLKGAFDTFIQRMYFKMYIAGINW